ncbi:hypothetical protein HT031_003456 [Scenedesmus sp. PABB004]|nr:hypothetical protein HT031_003456 [Scenedesmus sp. PABB004]
MWERLCRALRRLLACGAGGADGPAKPGLVADCEVKVVVAAARGGGAQVPPEVFTRRYGTVVPHDVTAREAVCLTSSVAVLGDARQSGGDSCITGDVFVAGDVDVAGSPCVTGSVVVLGSARVKGQVCVTGDLFVGRDLAVVGRLHVGGRLCVWGSKDVQPGAPVEG